MMCADCSSAFFQSPVKLAIVMLSIFISILSLGILKFKKDLNINKKIGLIYLHIFGLVFPIFFYIFFNGCSALFSSCGTAKATVYLIIITGITAAILGAFLAPFLFMRNHRQNSAEIKAGFASLIVRQKSEELGIKQPKLYLMKTAKPIAFSFSLFKPSIFISAGMADILTKNEIESVLLHELHHVKTSSSRLKLSTSLLRIFSPAAHIASFKNELSKAENEADNFAIMSQQTSLHINSVKKKLFEYEKGLR